MAVHDPQASKPTVLLPPSPNWYGAHIADWACDGSLYAFAARNVIVLVQPAAHACIAVLSSHTSRVTVVAFVPCAADVRDSALRLVSAAADCCVRVWDCRACKCLRAARGLPAEPSAAAVLRTGMLAVLGDKQGNMLTWRLDSASSKPVRLRMRLSAPIVSLAANPSVDAQEDSKDGSGTAAFHWLISSSYGGAMHAWAVPLRSGEPPPPPAPWFLAAAVNDTAIQVCGISGTSLTQGPLLRGHSGRPLVLPVGQQDRGVTTGAGLRDTLQASLEMRDLADAAAEEAGAASGPARVLAAQRGAALRLMRGDVGGALEVLAGSGALTADFVSMAAAGGRRVWEAAVRALAAQLETQGEQHLAALHLLSVADTVGLSSAAGCILAQDILAQEPLPPFPASIKDGYAVRSHDGPGEYSVEVGALAGTAPGRLSPGYVAYIGTGGPLPEGADAVVQIEHTEQLPPEPSGRQRVRIVKAAKGPGDDVRAVGSDIKAGEVVLQRGDRLGAAEIGLLATVGAAKLQVGGRPRVGVLSTGNELVEPGVQQLAPGQIRDANRAMLAAAAQAAGALVVDLGIAGDEAGQVEAKFEETINSGVDVLLTTGGVSMGDKDFIKPLLERRGTVHFGKVRMKPGKPLTFATLEIPAAGGSTRPLLVFGLPGNPVSSIVTFTLVVLPALRKLAGWLDPSLRRVHARLAAPLKLDPERPEYHRATLHWERRLGMEEGAVGGELVAESTGGQISSRLLSMRSANALLELPQASGTLPAGTMVSALLIADLGMMPVAESVALTAQPAAS
ncbi:hypothetical protein WJX81_006905 [Elliptochloris bilobata]|uniref:Molybdopterin biosynthesis protein CNX1 n=1 Tax=Elliptochloris bilobata TaxID=381761 RepID=A0AAW1S3I1_9CHLO